MEFAKSDSSAETRHMVRQNSWKTHNVRREYKGEYKWDSSDYLYLLELAVQCLLVSSLCWYLLCWERHSRKLLLESLLTLVPPAELCWFNWSLAVPTTSYHCFWVMLPTTGWHVLSTSFSKSMNSVYSFSTKGLYYSMVLELIVVHSSTNICICTVFISFHITG